MHRKWCTQDVGAPFLVEFGWHQNIRLQQTIPMPINMTNARILHLIDLLTRLYHGDNWVAESFEGKLSGLNETDVFTQPVPGVHSVAEIVWHCIYWRNVTIQRLLGNNQYREQTLEKFNFLPLDELKEKGWLTLTQQLIESQAEIISILQNKTDSFLTTIYEPHHNFDFLVEGTIQHDYYHLGQIGLVLKILKVQTS